MAGEICSLLKEKSIWSGLSCEWKCSPSERLTSLPSCRLSCNKLREIIPPARRPSDNLSPIFPCFHESLYLQFSHFPVPACRCSHPSWTRFLLLFFSFNRSFQVGSRTIPACWLFFSLGPHQICISSSESSVYLTLHSRARAVHLTLIRFRTKAGAKMAWRGQMFFRFFPESTREREHRGD